MDDTATDRTTVTFDLPATGTPDEAGDLVLYPDSVLMKAGDYSQSKGIILAPEDLKRTEEEFDAPIPNVFHHVKALHGISHKLEGKLGQVLDVWTEDDGRTLKGTVAIPRWLDEVWGDGKTVSTEWDPTTKRLNALGVLIDKPFIQGAALMAAFAAATGDRTFEGASAIQRIHDQAAQAGAICSKATTRKAGEPYFNSADEAQAIQGIHDAAIRGGAKCRMIPDRNERPDVVAPFAGTGNWKVGAARNLPLLDDNDTGWDGPAAERSIWGDSDTPPADARRAFLVYDASAPDLKGSYKLPFAIRKGEKLWASRAGLRIAATRIPKTDASEPALTRARAVVDGYQARFAKLDKGKDGGGGKDGKTAAMSTDDALTFAARIRHESATAFWQDFHDAAVELDPAVCDPKAKAARPDKARGDAADFADHPKQLKDIKKAHDLAVEHGATCPGRTATMSQPGPTPSRAKAPRGKGAMMGLKHALGRLLYGDQAPDAEPDVSDDQARAIFAVATGDSVTIEEEETVATQTAETVTAPPPAAPTPEQQAAAFAATPQYLEMKAELDRQKAVIEENTRKERERAEKELHDRAVTFAAGLATGDPARNVLPRITPVAIDAVAAVFAQAARDDAAAAATVTFSVGDKQVSGGRVAALEALFAALPGHKLLGQSIAPDGRLDPATHQVLFHQGTTEKPKADPDVVRRMLAATSVGHQSEGAAKANGTAG
jgi:hypothetical protein